MKNALILSALVLSQSVFAGSIAKEKLSSPHEAREAIRAHIEEVYKKDATKAALSKSLLEALDSSAKEETGDKAKFVVRQKALSGEVKGIITEVLNISAKNAGLRLTGGTILVDAISKQPKLMLDILQLMSQGKDGKADIELLAKSFENLSSDGAAQQKEILAAAKIITLAKTATGKLKENMEKAKKALDEGKSVLEALKAAGLKGDKSLEDFIIC